MRLVPFEPDHMRAIEWQDAQAEGREFYSDEWNDDVAENSAAWTALADDGAVIACAGVYPTRIEVCGEESRPVLSLAWAVFSPLLPRYAKGVYAAIARFLAGRTEARIEAYVNLSHTKAACFLERLGFQAEGVLVDEHPDGRDLLLFARVRH